MILKEDPESWTDKLRMSTFINQVSNLINEKPKLDGKWIDLNYTSNGEYRIKLTLNGRDIIMLHETKLFDIFYFFISLIHNPN